QEFKDLFTKKEGAHNSFVRDCVLETDLEIRIPDTYVNEVNERLSLYQAMDDLKSEEELIQFSKELIDRFGPLPEQVKELMLSFQLRWLAQDLGIEKLVIKGGKMVGFMISDPQSKFYESPIFQVLLKRIQTGELPCTLAEKNDKLRMVFTNVHDVHKAFKLFASIREVQTEAM
ncbi:MAG: hypothetical protein P8I94_00905, partial [Emcibacteraceae bacterium]|nr:hypothetical protein [Emcibacteraceae bacterium]